MPKIIILLAFFYSTLGSCETDKQPGIVNIIIYGNFLEPQKTYDSIIADFEKTGLVDSVKVVGRPILAPIISFKVDSLKAEMLEVDIEAIHKLTDTISYNNFSEQIINKLFVSSKNGAKIPISAITQILLEQNYYKPAVFLPEPACFKFKNECVAKVELHCSKKNVRKLANYALEAVQNYTNNFAIENWQYEIIKNEVINSNEE